MKNKKGFSLIEALVALGILAFIVAAILSGFSAQIYTNSKTREKNLAISLAEERIEEVLKYSRDQLNNMGVIGSTIIEDFSQNITPTNPLIKSKYANLSDYKGMKRITTITQDPTNSELLDIKVTVEYGKRGSVYPFKVTLVTKRGG